VAGSSDQKDGKVTSPAWLTAGLAGLMLLIAAASASRLAIGRIRKRATETGADALHILMGLAMAGMFEPRLGPVPDAVWGAVFAAAAAWFGWQAIRARGHRSLARPRCASPGPHIAESAAMLYMLVAVRPEGGGAAMAMPGMSSSASTGNPALPLVLAMLMLGYILWKADQLATLSRVRATAADLGRNASRQPAAATQPAGTGNPLALGPAAIAQRGSAASAAVAPRLAACTTIAMSIAMGYMLITLA
jgi:hypothetical protein